MAHSRLSFGSRICFWALMSISVTSVLTAQTQVQQANCTFNDFLLNSADPNNPSVVVGGVNDYVSVVGTAYFGNTSKAFIRYSGGNVSYWQFSGGAPTWFIARNNQGVSAGGYRDSSNQVHSFLLKGSTLTPIVRPNSVPNNTFIGGINNWNSIVGTYATSDGKTHSYKRYSNGSFVDLPDYPYAISHWGHSTSAAAINDSGVIVGSYEDGTLIASGTKHVQGFIYRNGQWATLNYLDADTTATWLRGISNSGIIVGSADAGSFLYANGTFKLIQVPKAQYTYVEGISPNGQLISGYAMFGDNAHGFTAKCH